MSCPNVICVITVLCCCRSGGRPIQTDSLVVEFSINGEVVPCGATFNSTDAITVSHNLKSRSYEFLVEVSGGTFVGSDRCANRLETSQANDEGNVVNVLEDELTIYGARSTGKRTTVRYSPLCTITKASALTSKDNLRGGN